MKQIAIIRIRGKVGLHKEVKDTLNMLRLYRQNQCVVVPSNPSYVGMITKVKDYVTWGEVNEETLILLLQKRGRLAAKKQLTDDYVKNKVKLDITSFAKEVFGMKKQLRDVPGLKPFFKLHPPIGGYERKGIKKPFSLGGVLGYRKDKINDLIKRMV
ncbi:MAG: 50S ribosomal protein L30 [archaeon]